MPHPMTIDSARSIGHAYAAMAERRYRPGAPSDGFGNITVPADEAAESCTWCPARRACHLFAVSNGEKYGVWGGEDRTTTTRKRDAA